MRYLPPDMVIVYQTQHKAFTSWQRDFVHNTA